VYSNQSHERAAAERAPVASCADVPVAYVGLSEEGWADGYVELGGGPFSRRSGPAQTSLDQALAWARAVAPRIVVTTVQGQWSAGAEPVDDLPTTQPAALQSSDWPAVSPPRADAWRATLRVDAGFDDNEFLTAVAQVICGRIDPERQREVVFDVAGGPRDASTRDAEGSVDAAWERTVASVGRAPKLYVSSLSLEPLGAVQPSRPTIALIDGFDAYPDGRRRWRVRFHDDSTNRQRPPHMVSFEECRAYAEQNAEVVLTRVATTTRGAPYQLADHSPRPF
jgi:hypothetical protein